MFNNREKEYNELMVQAEAIAGQIKSGQLLSAEAAESFSGKLGYILAATDFQSLWAAVGAALDVFIAKLYPGTTAPKWTKIAKSVVQVVAFVVATIKSYKNLKK